MRTRNSIIVMAVILLALMASSGCSYVVGKVLEETIEKGVEYASKDVLSKDVLKDQWAKLIGKDGKEENTEQLRKNKALILSLQKALNNKGANPKLVEDGIWGKNTERAVKEFQRQSGIKSTGQLDMKTIELLDLLPNKEAQTTAAIN